MSATLETQQFDVIVIGSGIGGLTVATLLAKLNRKKVLVLEQHFTPGGFTHSFSRKGKYQWDVGLHYVGSMGKGTLEREIFDYLTNGTLQWQKMPSPFEKFIYPDFVFEVQSNPKRFRADLIQEFPHERTAINRYFRDIRSAALWFAAHAMLETFPSWIETILKRLVRHFGAIARQTTHQYLDRHFKDVRLKALLVSQWVDYGLPPERSSFGIHSIIATHYLDGGWYPVGGGKAIAQAMIPIIEQAGGRVVTQRRVTEILLESGTAVGVKVQHTAQTTAPLERYDAPIVVSNAGVFNTYEKLITQTYTIPARQTIRDFPKGCTFLTVYLGLKDSPQKLGFQGENHWIYATYNHDSIIQDRHLTLDHFPKFCYLSFPSLKDPLAESHTAEIIGYANYDDFQEWQNYPWKRRGKAYMELKTELAKSFIQLIEGYYPGFETLIDYIELSTPLTVEHFDASDCGAVYGIPFIPERFDQPWANAKTPIKNLYLTGSDAFCAGIFGALMGGIKTAGLLNGSLGFFKIMAQIMKG